MKKQLDLNDIAALEKAIRKKYGDLAIQTPKQNWTPEKEKEYLEQVKEFYKKFEQQENDAERLEKEGFLVSSKLVNRDSDRLCLICDLYSFKSDDDLYMTKFGCCKNCYLVHIDCPGGLEEWESKKKKILGSKARKKQDED